MPSAVGETERLGHSSERFSRLIVRAQAISDFWTKSIYWGSLRAVTSRTKVCNERLTSSRVKNIEIIREDDVYI